MVKYTGIQYRDERKSNRASCNPKRGLKVRRCRAGKCVRERKSVSKKRINESGTRESFARLLYAVARGAFFCNGIKQISTRYIIINGERNMYLHTLTHKKELFVPNDPGFRNVHLRSVPLRPHRQPAHLHWRKMLKKSLRYLGYNVKRVMNITDVGHLASDADTGEDKMLIPGGSTRPSWRSRNTIPTPFCRLRQAEHQASRRGGACDQLHQRAYPHGADLAGQRLCLFLPGATCTLDTSTLKQYYVFNDHDEEDLAAGVREGVEEDTNKKTRTTSFSGSPRASSRIRR